MIARREQVLNYAILGFFSLLALYPIVGIVLTALAPPGEQVGLSLPSSLHLGNFREAWDEGHFATYLRSSVIVAVSVVAASTVLSILSGFAFGTMRFRGSTVLFYVFLLGLMVPQEALVVPLYFDLRRLELTDTYWALILPQVALSVAFGTFWMRSFFLAAPRSLLEAARIDGANEFRIFWTVVMPLATPVLATLGILTFLGNWNSFIYPLVMAQEPDMYTLPVALATFATGQYQADHGMLMAGSVILVVPVLIVFILFQRWITEGIATTGLKG